MSLYMNYKLIICTSLLNVRHFSIFCISIIALPCTDSINGKTKYSFSLLLPTLPHYSTKMYSQARLILPGHLAAQLASLCRRIRRCRNALTRFQTVRQTNGSRTLLCRGNKAKKNKTGTLEMIKNEAQPAKENAAYTKYEGLPVQRFTNLASAAV